MSEDLYRAALIRGLRSAYYETHAPFDMNSWAEVDAEELLDSTEGQPLCLTSLCLAGHIVHSNVKVTPVKQRGDVYPQLEDGTLSDYEELAEKLLGADVDLQPETYASIGLRLFFTSNWPEEAWVHYERFDKKWEGLRIAVDFYVSQRGWAPINWEREVEGW